MATSDMSTASYVARSGKTWFSVGYLVGTVVALILIWHKGRSVAQGYKDIVNHDVIRKIKSRYPPRPPVYDPSLCSSYKTVVIICVNSKPENFYLRQVIRNTYLHPDLKKKVNIASVFAVGKQSRDQMYLPKNLILEFQEHRDLFLGDFIDSDKNIIDKELAMLRLISTLCRHVDLVVKVDDLTIVNTPGIMEFLLPKLDPAEKFILGHLRTGDTPKQCKNESEICVRNENYPGEIYPPYMGGPWVVLTGDMVPLLYNASQYVTVVGPPDVFLTGILPKSVPDVRMVDLTPFMEIIHGQAEINCAHDPNRPLLIGRMRSADQIRACWRELHGR